MFENFVSSHCLVQVLFLASSSCFTNQVFQKKQVYKTCCICGNDVVVLLFIFCNIVFTVFAKNVWLCKLIEILFFVRQ